jgi:hypothetical protein
MIQISKVHDYNFPTIDFKFQNTGATTAVLWQFAIEILEAEVDPTPELEFRYAVDAKRFVFRVGADAGSFDGDNTLQVYAINNGWGAAYSCETILEEPALNHFFTEEQRRFIGSIESGGNKQILRLLPTWINLGRFKEFHERAMQVAKEEMERCLPEFLGWNKHMTVQSGYAPDALEKSYREYQKETRARFEQQWFMTAASNRFPFGTKGASVSNTNSDRLPVVPISALTLRWKCKDAKGRQREERATAEGPGHNRELYLTANGFMCIEHWHALCVMPSDVTYCTIIDPSLGPHERIYPISRMIPPGDVERFHILIGASKSCNLRLRFKFSSDRAKVSMSDEFAVQIWNPRGSRLKDDYKDGEQLKRREAELKSKTALDQDERWELRNLERELDWARWQKSDDSGYPFIKPNSQRRR